jgi:succinate dehydrogenase / fumarate reductase iron-sulfur subunit
VIPMGRVDLHIRRGNGSEGSEDQSYSVELDEYATVLEALLRIREEQDPTLAVRYSCRMGMCGSCGVLIDGRPKLACLTRVTTLGSEIRVAPLPTFPRVRDLVPELGSFFRRYQGVDPTLRRLDAEEQAHPTRVYRQAPSEVHEYLQFNYCVQCGLCYAACPIAHSDEEFVGPAALTVAERYTADSRDEGRTARVVRVDARHGVWGCRTAGSCSEACPKGVDPSLAIQRLKGRALRRG